MHVLAFPSTKRCYLYCFLESLKARSSNGSFDKYPKISKRTIRHRLQQRDLSARRPLLALPLTQNHRRMHRQWCDKRRKWAEEWNEVVFTDESRICLQHHDGRIRVWRHRGERMLNSYVMHRHVGPDRVSWYGAVLDITLALL
ncbi:transposable element Tcb1 transposase [Trichonephila clavipes]|nr:transposable element Tcb1 transposase [Trichonephila clavipes]